VSVPDDTGIGGGGGDRFPSTHWSAAARSSDPRERRRAFEAIVQAYWKPVYKYVRIHWRRSNEDAKDLTQSFFTRLIEKDDLAVEIGGGRLGPDRWAGNGVPGSIHAGAEQLLPSDLAPRRSGRGSGRLRHNALLTPRGEPRGFAL
jgi:hypothetical protein